MYIQPHESIIRDQCFSYDDMLIANTKACGVKGYARPAMGGRPTSSLRNDDDEGAVESVDFSTAPLERRCREVKISHTW